MDADVQIVFADGPLSPEQRMHLTAWLDARPDLSAAPNADGDGWFLFTDPDQRDRRLPALLDGEPDYMTSALLLSDAGLALVLTEVEAVDRALHDLLTWCKERWTCHLEVDGDPTDDGFLLDYHYE